MPACANCGSSDFVWTDQLRTGALRNGRLSLRSRGGLPLGSRICRGCGRAELFVKDLSVLRDPKLWETEEFVTVAPSTETTAVPPAPTNGAVAALPSPESPPTARPANGDANSVPVGTETKRATRKRVPRRAEPPGPPLIHD